MKIEFTAEDARRLAVDAVLSSLGDWEKRAILRRLIDSHLSQQEAERISEQLLISASRLLDPGTSARGAVEAEAADYILAHYRTEHGQDLRSLLRRRLQLPSGSEAGTA